MKTSDFRTKATSARLKESMNKMFDVNVNLDKYSREQLEDIRNKLRTRVFQQEGKAGINDLLTNETYQKDKVMLALLNTRIKEMLGEQMQQLRDKMTQLSEAKKDKTAKKKCPPMSHIKKMCQDGKSVSEICKMHPDCDHTELKQMVADCKGKMDEAKKGVRDIKHSTKASGSKPDFLDLDKDGNKNEPMKSAAKSTKMKEGKAHPKSCKCDECSMMEEPNEGNAFGKAVRDAKADGIQKGEKIKVGGKEYPVKEAAKWRNAEHKGKLYTQEPDDGEGDHYDYYRDSRPENDPGEKRSTFNRNKNTDNLHYPYGDYQVGQKAQVGDRAKKGLLTKNAIAVVKNRIKGTQGNHPTPNLPEGFPTVADAQKAHAEKGTAGMKVGDKQKSSTGGEVTKTATGLKHTAGKNYGGKDAPKTPDSDKKMKEGKAHPKSCNCKECMGMYEGDMGKHNNATTGFKALAKKAGGGEKGKKIAGAQFQKMKKAGQLESQFKHNVRFVNESLQFLLQEDEEGKAKAITSAGDMVNDFTSWMQRVGQYQTKTMIELADAIKADFGAAEAEAFKQAVGPALSATLETLTQQREAVSGAVAVLAGEATPDAGMGMEPGMDTGMPPEPGMDAAAPDAMNPEPAGDEFGASDAAAGMGTTGREMRESKFARKLAESHSILSKLAK
jgi:hypothetical protein